MGVGVGQARGEATGWAPTNVRDSTKVLSVEPGPLPNEWPSLEAHLVDQEQYIAVYRNFWGSLHVSVAILLPEVPAGPVARQSLVSTFGSLQSNSMPGIQPIAATVGVPVSSKGESQRGGTQLCGSPADL